MMELAERARQANKVGWVEWSSFVCSFNYSGL